MEDRAAEKSATGQDLKSTLGHAGDIPVDISRGPAGDCCIYCGRVAVDLPVDHACRPNLSPEDLAVVAVHGVVGGGQGEGRRAAPVDGEPELSLCADYP